MIFTKLLPENVLAVQPCNYEAVLEPFLPKVARCIPVLSKKMAFCKVHDEYWAVNLESFGLGILSNTETTSKSCIISKHGLVLHEFDFLL